MDAKLRIALLNDRFRQYDGLKLGRKVVTSSVAAKGLVFQALCLMAVAEFKDFCTGNDPYEEHDFGSLQVNGEVVLFKIDYYERGSNFEHGAEDPSNEETTERLLTIMLAEDY